MKARRSRVQVLWSAVLLCLPLVGMAELPGDSVYRLAVTLVDQDGRSFPLAARAGKVQLVSMFYTSCQYVCPLTVATMKRTQARLDPPGRSKLRVLLVSFDPARDTPERLRTVFAERHLDPATWTLARTDPASVRKLAATLDFQYRTLADGGISHSSALLLLDAEGRILARTAKTGEVDPEFVAKLKRALD
jgi:protein SCO1